MKKLLIIMFLVLSSISYAQININTSPPSSVYLRDASGNNIPLTLYGEGLGVVAVPYGSAVAEGDVPGHTKLVKVAYIGPVVNNASQTLWPYGGMYSFATQAQQLAVKSSSGNDIAGGTGIRQVTVKYLDANYNEGSEVVTLNGVTPVNLVATQVIRIQNVNAASAGSSLVAAGNIDTFYAAGTQVYSRIAAGLTNGAMSVWTVPNGKKAYITSWSLSGASTAANHYVVGRLRATCDTNGIATTPGIFQLKAIAVCAYGAFQRTYTFPLVFPSRTDIQITVIADSGTSNMECGGSIEGWYE